MVDFEPRPSSVYRHGGWHTMNGRSSEAGPSSNRAGRTSITGNSINSRRRSSAASGPPAGPPPNLPIPNLPALSEMSPFAFEDDEYGSAQEPDDDVYAALAHPEPPVFDLNPFQRPTASSQLTAVTQFSQARQAAENSVSPHSTNPNLSDSPPRSILPRTAPSQVPPPPPSHPPPQPPSSEISPDRLLLSPPEARDNHTPSRPSSRRALTRALELAKEAVKLDSTNNDPYGAIQAYGQSVALLNEVMERVMRGEDSTERRNGRRRSIVAQEEEVRRLRSIVSALSI